MCHFYKDKVCFLGYVVSAHWIQIKDERIEAVKNWLEPEFMHDIQVFLSFTNFYWRFIQGFSRIAGPLTLMLRTLSPTGSSTVLQSIDVADKDKVDKNGDNGTNLLNPSVSTRSIGAGYLTYGGAKRGGNNTKKGVGAAKGSNYLILAAKKVFNHLRYSFTQALILQHFDPKWHIRIETNASGYFIGGVLNQLMLNNLGQWNPVTYYLQKWILAKTWCKT